MILLRWHRATLFWGTQCLKNTRFFWNYYVSENELGHLDYLLDLPFTTSMQFQQSAFVCPVFVFPYQNQCLWVRMGLQHLITQQVSRHPSQSTGRYYNDLWQFVMGRKGRECKWYSSSALYLPAITGMITLEYRQCKAPRRTYHLSGLKWRERELGFFTLQSFSQDVSVPFGLFRKVQCVSEAPTLVIAVH